MRIAPAGKTHLLVGLLGAGLLLLISAPAVRAHPLGNFTVNQYSRLEIAPESVRVRYVIDMAEIPTVTERQSMDADANGEVDDSEAQAYLDRQLPTLVDGLSLTVDGTRSPLTVTARELSFPQGQAGLVTLRLVADLRADLRPGIDRAALTYRDGNYTARVGWHEMVIRALPGVRIDTSSSGPEDRSNELHSYPQELLTSPPEIRDATVDFAVVAVAEAPPPASALPGPTGAAASAPRPGTESSPFLDQLSSIVRAPDLTPAAIALSLALAVLLGAQHALTPGHGKTVMAAFLVGTRGTLGQAFLLGLTVTISHTLGVVLLGFLALAATSVLPPEIPERLLPLVSGLVVVALGLYLVVARLRDVRARRRQELPHATSAVGDPRGYDLRRPHGHEHPHGHDQAQDHDHAHSRARDVEEHAHHDLRAGDPGPDPADEAGWHDHGGVRHTHLPARIDERLGWRSLFLLGLSGGLVPSPAALLLLLGSVGAGRTAYGIILALAFGIGMAFVLVGIGILLVRARGLIDRLPRTSQMARLARALPLATAVIVLSAGLLITYGALRTAARF